MSKIKRAISLLLTFVMVLTMVSVGLTFTASAAAPYVTRTAASNPSPNTFTVPDYVTTYGDNENLSGNYIKAEGSVQFYLSGATDIVLSTNSSGVTVGTSTVVGNVTVWNISGGTLTNTSATNVKFTVSYKYNGKNFSSSAWSAVYPMNHDAVVRTNHAYHGTSVSRDIKIRKVMWLSPTFGSFSGTGGTKIFYIPVYSGDGDSAVETTDASVSGVYWYVDSGSGVSNPSVNMTNYISTAPIGWYYADLSSYSTMAQLPVKLYTREYEGDFDGNHPMKLTGTNIQTQTVNGGSVTTYGLAGTLSATLAQNTNYTTSFTGNLPAAGSYVNLYIHQSMKATCQWIWTQDIYTDDYIYLGVMVYNKTTLRNLVTSEKAANRQQGNYSTTAAITWTNYIAALQTASELLGRQNTTQAAIDAAVSALNAAIPVYINNGTSNGEWVSGMVFADASYESADFQISRIPSNFTNNTYPDGTKGNYYTWTTATAVNQAYEDIAYDRALNKKYQAVVDTMTVNLQTAIDALQYKSFNLVFNANGGQDAPATASYKLYTNVSAPSTAPTRQYYSFNGWYYNAACTVQASWPLTMSTANTYFAGDLNQKDDTIRTGITLYAGWTRTAVQISFDSNGGSAVSAVFGTPGTTTTAPTAPTKPGYTFVGWYSDVTLTNLVSFPYTFTSSDVTFYAKWDVAQFTVTFNSNGGSFTSTGLETYQVIQNYGTPVTEPEVPVKYGKGFAGWYFDNNTFASPVNFSSFTVPSSNITVYAKWSDTIYTITFNSNGGTSVPYASYAAGDTVAAPAQATTRAGYSFAAWCSDAALTTTVNFPFVMTAGSKIFYAKWTPLHYNVYFDLGDDAYAPLEAQFPESFQASLYYNLDCGSTLAAPEEPTMEGYVFKGWTLNGVAFTFPTTVPAQNITLVATWEAEPPTVTYRLRTDKTGTLQQGDVVTVTASIESNYIIGSNWFIVYYDKRYFEPALKGSTYTTIINGTPGCNTNGNTYFTMIDNPASVKVEGWNTWQNGTCTGRVNKSYEAIGSYYPATWRIDNETLLPAYANYDYVYFQVSNASTSPSSGYCVTADPEQDICRFQLKVKDTAPVTAPDDFAKILMPEEFTREDYAYGKIYAALEDGNTYDTAFQATGMTYVLPNSEMDFSIEEMETSTVSFVTNSTSTIDPVTDKVGRTITLPTPTKAYHDFLGWSLVDGSTTYVSNSYVVPESDVTLYAQWQAQSATYKVRHWKQNTTATGYLAAYEEETFSAVIGTTVSATPKTYAGFNTPNSVSDVVAADGSLILNLYYTRKTTTITLNLAGGTLSGSTALTGLYESAVTAPGTPTRTGYTFAGWLYNNVSYSFTTFPSASIEVVASWTANNYSFRFYLNGNLYDTITKPYGESVTPPTVDVPQGMVFSGWLYNGSPYTFTTMPAANMDFNGTLSIDGYYVTLFIDGTQYGDPIPVYNGTQLTAAQVAYTAPTGFTFSGWKLSNSINGVAASFPLTPTSNMNLYGFTSRAKYSITFWIVGEGDYYDRALNIPYESNITAYIPVIPDVDGFRFDAWYTDEALTQKFTATTMPAQNLNLYGAYIELTGTIKFNLNGGQGTTPADIVDTLGTTVTLPDDNGGTAFFRNEYVFVGWGLATDATETFMEYTIESEDPVILYAIWVPAAVELIPRVGSTSVVNNETKYITGLKVGITAEELINQYLDVVGSGEIIAPAIIGTGTTIQLKNNYTNEIVDEFTVVIYGDINNDGNITQTDMTMLKAIIAGSLTVNQGTALFKAVDFNVDGYITQADLTKLKSVISAACSLNQQNGVIA